MKACLKPVDKSALRNWDDFKRNMANSTPAVDKTPEEIEKHRIYLEDHPIEWILFFFSKYTKHPFAFFQIRAINRILKNADGNWYEVLSWSRELAKSTIVMFCVMYLVLTGKKKNVIIASATIDSAERLLEPYKKNLETNARIKQYYGDQVTIGDWTSTEFKAKCGASFRALGAGNAPRGTRNDEVRPDIIVMDDFDTDEACRNPETIKKNWKWFEEALFFTRSMSEKLLTIWCGNIIAKDCCVVRAGNKALELAARKKPLGNWDIINLKMVNINKPDPKNDFLHGISVWPEKNTEEIIEEVLAQVSKSAAQKECFNNPVSEGTVFVNLTFDKIPSLRKFKFLVIYGDPAPGESKKKSACFKAVWLVGRIGNKRYVIKGFLDKVLNSVFIEWYVKLLQYVGGKTNVYCYMENNKLQDPFFQQVFKPHVKRIKRKLNISLNILEDKERKTDKATRIETNLEPLDREGDLIFNVEEKENPHMKELIDQFELFELHLPYAVDGPDCIEGADRVIERKIHESEPTTTIPRKAFKNKYRM